MSSARARLCVAALCAGAVSLAPAASASARSVGPACQRRVPAASSLLAGAVTVSPAPGSREASPRTQISFLGAPAAALHVLSVKGSRTGRHPGSLLAYSQGDGASFVPARPFAEGETVGVRATLSTGSRSVALLDRFAIERRDPVSTTPETVHPVGTVGVQAFHSRPDLHPPAVTVTVASAAAQAGDVLLAPYSGPGQAGPMILDQSGALLWFKPLGVGVSATNLQVQQYLGRPVLTWWQGDITVHGFGLGEGEIADDSYAVIAHVRAGNGYKADLHELALTPRGTALITAYDPVRCNVSALGGPADGAVTDGILQEIDVTTGLVRFQWASLDHVALAESWEGARKSNLESPFDYFHINSIHPAPDGSLIVSARNTWATYDIDGRSGGIVWQLGGKHSTFTLARGAATAWQHDSRMLANGSISVFDNGSSPKIHQQSRGVVVAVNGQQRTAALVSEFAHAPPLLTESQGDMQPLANGDWFIGWGQVSDFSEFSPAGALVFDAHMPAHVQSYRDLRFSWHGSPPTVPTFVTGPGPSGTQTAFASWNGATQVASWALLAGPTASNLRQVATAPRSGFETAIPLPAEIPGPVLTVQALDASGAVLATAEPKALGS